VKTYTVQDAGRILQVKNHVLRYWTSEMPFIQPRKDITGHIRYTGRDLRLLLRVKHLLYTRRLSVETARRQLERELSDDWGGLRVELDALRAQLVDLLFC
jgi:DNA-binding transcriptional MerR regulator